MSPLQRSQGGGWITGVAFALFAAGSAALGGPFGMADPNFSRPQFKQTVFPYRVVSDRHGGLLWSMLNGSLDGANGLRLGRVVRTTESGDLDPSFQTGPIFTAALVLTVQPDGKILMGGAKAGDFSANGVINYRVFRLWPDGTLDTSYGAPVFDVLPRVATLQADGRLLIGGHSEINRGGNGGIINTVRLNSDGSLDASFHSPVIAGGANGTIFAPPVIDTAGRILLGGNFTSVNGANFTNIFRVLPDGTQDPSFVPSGVNLAGNANASIRGIVIQSDGKVVLGGGRFRLPNSGTTNYVLVRLNADGSLDGSFKLVEANTAGFVGINRIRMLREASDGKLLAVGSTMARFNADGSLDNSFTRLPFYDNYLDFYGECFWFELLAGGKLVLPPSVPLQVGTAQVAGPFWLNADGTLDGTRTPPLFQAEAYPSDSLRLPGGRVLVSGAFDKVGSTSKRCLARFEADGSLDPTYNFGAPGDLLSVGPTALLPDNSLYAVLAHGNDPSILAFPNSNSLAHILASGQLDASFQPAIDITHVPPPSLFLQNASPLIWWNSEQDVVDGRFPFYRLNSDGSIDASFVGITNVLGSFVRGSNGYVSNVTVGAMQVLAALPAGKLFASVTSNVLTYQVVRLNTNGTLDVSFAGPILPGGASFSSRPFISDPQNGQVYQVTSTRPVLNLVIAAQALGDGSVLVAGNFRQIGGYNIAGLAKLQSNGTVDAGFPGGSGAALSANPFRAARVDSVQLDGLGRIWITGNFDRFNGKPVKGIARLNPDGSVDSSVVSQASFYDYGAAEAKASSLIVNDDGSVSVLGTYRLANDAWPYALTRLVTYGPPTLTSLGYFGASGFWLTANLVEGQTARLQVSSNLQNWDDLIALTGGPAPITVGDPAARILPRRFYRLATP